MKFRRITAAALSGLLLAGALAGCTKTEGGNARGTEPTPAASVSAQPTSSPPAASGLADGVETEDVSQKLLGVPSDAEAFAVNGAPVSMEDYLYWMCYVLDNISYSAGGADKIQWDEEQDGLTFLNYVKESARDMAKLYQVVAEQAAANGVTLSEQDQATFESQVAATIAQSGGAEGYVRALQEVCRSDEGLRRMFSTSYLFAALQEKLFPAEEPTDEALTAWCDEQGKMQVKHILIKTVDDQGQDLAEEEQAAAKAKADGLLEQLRAAGDVETLFDQLMNENSEDGRDPNTGALYAPDGYFFGAGEMVQEFEAASKALAVGEFSDPVKTSYGYHIILRLPVDLTEARAAWDQAQAKVAQEQMDAQVSQWMEEAVVETGENYDAVDPKAFYEKLTAYREELEGAGGDAAADDTAQPSEAPDAAPAGE